MNISLLKFHREKSGITVRDLCRRVGITTPTYYKAINDNDIMASTLEKICKELKVSPMIFFDEKGYRIDEIIINELSESNVKYNKNKETHIGNLIEKRLDEIGMSVAEFGRRIGTSRQNALGILKRKSITWEHALQYNDVLNPPGSSPWDLFQFFLLNKPETIEDKYMRLLEEYNRLIKKQHHKPPK